MAIPTERIMLRSPYWVTQSDDNLDYMMIDLRIWNGMTSEEPTDPTIQLRSTALNGVASIDIAELARDYVEVSFNGNEESDTVIISYNVTTTNVAGRGDDVGRTYLIGFDGYGTFIEGVNPSSTEAVLLTSDIVSAYSNSTTKIPVSAAHVTSCTLQRRKNIGGSVSYPAITDVNNNPIIITVANPVDTSDAIEYIGTASSGKYADRIEITTTTGTEYVYIDYQECNKYGLSKVYFVNKFGAIQQMHFSGKHSISLSSDSEKYTRNLLDNGTYDNTRHQSYLLNKNGKFSINLNTGWVPEENNGTMIEMLMSEQIWIDIDPSVIGVGWVPKGGSVYTIPVQLTNKNMDVKTRSNEKLINYSLKFEAANNWINTVR